MCWLPPTSLSRLCRRRSGRVLVRHSDFLRRLGGPVEQERIHLDRDLVGGARLLVFVVDVVRGGVYLCSQARHDDVEQFAHQDARNGTRAFEKAPQDVESIGRCDGIGGFCYGADGLCNRMSMIEPSSVK